MIRDRGAAEQLLHGEPHPGNVLSTANGLVFVDIETCWGPSRSTSHHGARLVGPQGVEVAHEITAGQHGFGHRHDQLAGRQAPAALLIRPTQSSMAALTPTMRSTSVTSSRPAAGVSAGSSAPITTRRVRWRIVVTGRVPFVMGEPVASRTPILLWRKAVVADGRRASARYLRIQVRCGRG